MDDIRFRGGQGSTGAASAELNDAVAAARSQLANNRYLTESQRANLEDFVEQGTRRLQETANERLYHRRAQAALDGVQSGNDYAVPEVLEIARIASVHPEWFDEDTRSRLEQTRGAIVRNVDPVALDTFVNATNLQIRAGVNALETLSDPDRLNLAAFGPTGLTIDFDLLRPNQSASITNRSVVPSFDASLPASFRSPFGDSSATASAFSTPTLLGGNGSAPTAGNLFPSVSVFDPPSGADQIWRDALSYSGGRLSLLPQGTDSQNLRAAEFAIHDFSASAADYEAWNAEKNLISRGVDWLRGFVSGTGQPSNAALELFNTNLPAAQRIYQLMANGEIDTDIGLARIRALTDPRTVARIWGTEADNSILGYESTVAAMSLLTIPLTAGGSLATGSRSFQLIARTAATATSNPLTYATASQALRLATRLSSEVQGIAIPTEVALDFGGGIGNAIRTGDWTEARQTAGQLVSDVTTGVGLGVQTRGTTFVNNLLRNRAPTLSATLTGALSAGGASLPVTAINMAGDSVRILLDPTLTTEERNQQLIRTLDPVNFITQGASAIVEGGIGGRFSAIVPEGRAPTGTIAGDLRDIVPDATRLGLEGFAGTATETLFDPSMLSNPALFAHSLIVSTLGEAAATDAGLNRSLPTGTTTSTHNSVTLPSVGGSIFNAANWDAATRQSAIELFPPSIESNTTRLDLTGVFPVLDGGQPAASAGTGDLSGTLSFVPIYRERGSATPVESLFATSDDGRVSFSPNVAYLSGRDPALVIADGGTVLNGTGQQASRLALDWGNLLGELGGNGTAVGSTAPTSNFVLGPSFSTAVLNLGGTEPSNPAAGMLPVLIRENSPVGTGSAADGLPGRTANGNASVGAMVPGGNTPIDLSGSVDLSASFPMLEDARRFAESRPETSLFTYTVGGESFVFSGSGGLSDPPSAPSAPSIILASDGRPISTTDNLPASAEPRNLGQDGELYYQVQDTPQIDGQIFPDVVLDTIPNIPPSTPTAPRDVGGRPISTTASQPGSGESRILGPDGRLYHPPLDAPQNDVQGFPQVILDTSSGAPPSAPTAPSVVLGADGLPISTTASLPASVEPRNLGQDGNLYYDVQDAPQIDGQIVPDVVIDTIPGVPPSMPTAPRDVDADVRPISTTASQPGSAEVTIFGPDDRPINPSQDANLVIPPPTGEQSTIVTAPAREPMTASELRSLAQTVRSLPAHLAEQVRGPLLWIVSHGQIPSNWNDIHAHNGGFWGTYDPRFAARQASLGSDRQYMERHTRMLGGGRSMQFYFPVAPSMSYDPAGFTGRTLLGANAPAYYNALTALFRNNVIGRIQLTGDVARIVEPIRDAHGNVVVPRLSMPREDFEVLIGRIIPRDVTEVQFVPTPVDCNLHYQGVVADRESISRLAAQVRHEIDLLGYSPTQRSHFVGLTGDNPLSAQGFRSI